MSGVTRYNIGGLGPNVTDAMVIAVIIAKQQPRTMPCKRGTGPDRAVWNFTIRDSPEDFINVAMWGDAEFVTQLADGLHIGDVVELVNARVSFRQGGEQDEKYRPFVTSAFTLSLAEEHSSLQLHGEPEAAIELRPLVHVATKPTANFLTLTDVHHGGSLGKCSEGVDLLVAVAKVGAVRDIHTKSGRDVQCREILLLDYTTSEVTFQLWDPEMILCANNWTPRDTVLFLADARVEWNSFKKSMVVAMSARTVVTQDPSTPEAVALRNYARTVPLQPSELLDHMASSFPDPNTIRTVMSVCQVQKKALVPAGEHEEMQFASLLYCFISQLDLDGCTQVVVCRCHRCKTPSPSQCDTCYNLECPVSSGTVPACFSYMFDIRVSLSDHTGTIDGVRLTGATAEKVLGVTVDDFLVMSDDERTNLKWSLLLERCAARILVLRARRDRPRPLVSLVACSLADPAKVAALLPVH